MKTFSWPLTLERIEHTLDVRGLNPEPSGTAEFHYTCEGKDYFLFCARLPELFIRRFVDVSGTEYGPHIILSAVNSVNERGNLVKVAIGDDDRLQFQLGWRQGRYVDFLADILPLTHELDDAVKSFFMTCDLCMKEEGRPMEEFLKILTDPENPMLGSRKIRS
ncbi:MAG: hypothetical protein J5775_06755 [Spirochaetales bacterium]|nr:hypothetical protein [Spirochaetales bacterium]